MMQTSPGRMPGEALEFDHRPNLPGDVGPDRVNERIRDRLDRLRLPDVGPAPTEAGDRLEAVMDGGRDHLLPDGPLERPDDLADPLVDLVPAEAGIDHRLADGLEPERPELPGQGVAVELAERPEGQPDVDRLRRRLAVLDVVGVGVIGGRPTSISLTVRSDPEAESAAGEPSAGGQPLGDEPVVLGPALGGAVLAEIEVPTVEGNDGLAGRLVESVGRECGGWSRHGTASNPVDYRLSWSSIGRSVRLGQVR